MTAISSVLALVLAVQTAYETVNQFDMTSYMYPPTVSASNGTSYDYIIAGGGTAGSVVASRLAANGSSVLVVEAGTAPPVQSMIAGGIPLMIKSSLDYQYTAQANSSSPYNITKYKYNGQFYSIAGKMLGGSSNIFTQYHIRSDALNYDQWAEYLNDSSYSYESLLPYFIKSENLLDDDILEEFSSEHGTEGPIGIEKIPYDVLEKYLEAFAELDNAIVLEKNGNISLGYFEPLYEIASNMPHGAGHRYLGMMKNSDNLSILTNSIVTRVLFDEDKTATGIEVQATDGSVTTYTANKEVILAAGVFNSPKVLMLSGIGPKEHLESLNISVLADLPVGENLQDLYGALLGFKMDVLNETAPLVSPLHPYPYFVGYTALNRSQNYPDYLTENFHIPADLSLVAVFCATVMGFSEDICQTYLDVEDSGYNFYLTGAISVSPKSRGYVRLSSTDPTDSPTVIAPYLNDLEDLDDIVKYVKDHYQVINTTYFKSIGAEYVKPNITECEDYEVGTDEYWYCYVPNMLMPIFKVTSSCAMGSVVDTSFKVKGFENLRVVDASVFPNVTRAHIISTVYAMAEKAADLIIADS